MAAKGSGAQSGRAEGHNPMPLLIDAAQVHASEGEILATLQQVWATTRTASALLATGTTTPAAAPRIRVVVATPGLDGPRSRRPRSSPAHYATVVAYAALSPMF